MSVVCVCMCVFAWLCLCDCVCVYTYMCVCSCDSCVIEDKAVLQAQSSSRELGVEHLWRHRLSESTVYNSSMLKNSDKVALKLLILYSGPFCLFWPHTRVLNWYDTTALDTRQPVKGYYVWYADAIGGVGGGGFRRRAAWWLGHHPSGRTGKEGRTGLTRTTTGWKIHLLKWEIQLIKMRNAFLWEIQFKCEMYSWIEKNMVFKRINSHMHTTDN